MSVNLLSHEAMVDIMVAVERMDELEFGSYHFRRLAWYCGRCECYLGGNYDPARSYVTFYKYVIAHYKIIHPECISILALADEIPSRL